ncbi:MAG: HPP family protein [Methanobacteriota archaeon]|nr:MAG: HPP family protein [Euryarchaeota archaeon]
MKRGDVFLIEKISSLSIGTVAMTLLFFASPFKEDLILFTSVASTVFWIFSRPEGRINARRILISYILAFIAGVAVNHFLFGSQLLVRATAGLVIAFIGMVLLDAEHAPAAGIALSTIISSSRIGALVALLAALLFLVAVFGIIKLMFIVVEKKKNKGYISYIKEEMGL